MRAALLLVLLALALPSAHAARRAPSLDDINAAEAPKAAAQASKPAPSGTLKVVRVAHNPTYTYNPAFAFKGVKAKRELKFAPGPNNPVGVVCDYWVARFAAFAHASAHGGFYPSKRQAKTGRG